MVVDIKTKLSIEPKKADINDELEWLKQAIDRDIERFNQWNEETDIENLDFFIRYIEYDLNEFCRKVVKSMSKWEQS